MSIDKLSLGDRMKEYYENAYRFYFTRRTPVVIRLDGKAFHTFTRSLDKPFDEAFSKCMSLTTLALCQRIQGCKFAYTQSDEISLILTDYDELETSAWFDNNIQKMVSVSASLAGVYFNYFVGRYLPQKASVNAPEVPLETKDFKELPVFDSRAFNLPQEEVCNYLYWRQLDCTRNSIQALGQANFSHKELHSKSCSEIQDMLMSKKCINWNDLPIKYKRGISFFRVYNEEGRGEWSIDENMPVLSQDRGYVEKHIIKEMVE